MKALKEIIAELKKENTEFSNVKKEYDDAEKAKSGLKEDISKEEANLKKLAEVEKEIDAKASKVFSQLSNEEAGKHLQSRAKLEQEKERIKKERDETWKDIMTRKENGRMADFQKNDAMFSKAKQKYNDAVEKYNQSEAKVDELQKQFADTSREETKIKAFIPEVLEKYGHVKENEGFRSDFLDPRGATPQEAEQKFGVLPDKKLLKIAEAMNKGNYVSSPDESKGIPIMEIIKNMFGLMGSLLVGGLERLYGVANQALNRKDRLKIQLIITGGLIAVIVTLAVMAGELIVSLLMKLLFVIVLVFAGMLLFNIIKFSNKALRKERNLEYYTVGYYFQEKEDEILYRIAKILYEKMKDSGEEELKKYLDQVWGNMPEKIRMAELERNKLQEELAAAEKDYDAAEDAHIAEEARIKEHYSEMLDRELAEMDLNEKKQNEAAQATFLQEYQDADDEWIKKENEVKEAVQKEKEKCRRKTEKANANIASCKAQISELEEKQSDLEKKAENLEQSSKDLRKAAKGAEIDAVDVRSGNDTLPDKFLIGFKKGTALTGQQASYTPFAPEYIRHGFKPVIISFSGENEESQNVGKNFYRMVDFMLADMITRTYLGAFTFQLIDSKGNKTSILNCMDSIHEGYETLEEAGIVRILTERADSAVDRIIAERERLLEGKTIDVVNEANKNLDNMVRYIILCIRVYNKQGTDFDMKQLNMRLNKCRNNGIIPVILMSEEVFEASKEWIQLPIKEQCDQIYYKWDLKNETDEDQIHMNLCKMKEEK